MGVDLLFEVFPTMPDKDSLQQAEVTIVDACCCYYDGFLFGDGCLGCMGSTTMLPRGGVLLQAGGRSIVLVLLCMQDGSSQRIDQGSGADLLLRGWRCYSS